MRLINPTAHHVEGYWWTDTQMPMTSSTFKGPEVTEQVFVPESTRQSFLVRRVAPCMARDG